MAKQFDEMTDEELAAARGDIVDETEEDIGDEEEQQPDEEPETDEEPAEEAVLDEEPEEEPPAKPAPKNKGPMLPKSRYDQKARQVRELEARLQALEAQQQQKEQGPSKAEQQAKQREELNTQLETLDDQINDALLDGDKAKAKDLRKQVRDLERKLFQSEMQDTAEATRQRTLEEVKLDLLIDQVEERVPSLNPSSDVFDQDLLSEVQALWGDFERAGHSPTQALIRAIRYTVPSSGGGSEVTEPTKSDVAEAKRAERKGEAVKRGVEATRKSPPKLKDVGEESSSRGVNRKLDPSKLTQKDFDSLPESTLKRLRGDFL